MVRIFALLLFFILGPAPSAYGILLGSHNPTLISGTADGTGAANGYYRYDGNLRRVKSVVNGATIYNVYDAAGSLIYIDDLGGSTAQTSYVSGPSGTFARIKRQYVTNLNFQGNPGGYIYDPARKQYYTDDVTYLHNDHLGSALSGMERANIKRPVRLNNDRTDYDGNPSNRRVIGRVIAKTLGRDEGMNPDAKGGGKVRFIIDGTDGYVSTVETGIDTRAGEAAKVGSIIEVTPPSLRTVDRNIQALATGKDYHAKPRNGLVGNYAIATSGPEDWVDGNGSRSAAHMRAHRLRLATLAKAGVVQVVSKDKDGDPYEWRVPDDFEKRAISLDLKQGRASGVKLLSRQDLDTQLESPGATWLDRAQVSWGRGELSGISTRTSAFANELDTAFQQRRTWLIERGYAELRQDEQKTSIIYKRGYMKALETEGFNAATEKLESMTGKAHVAAQAGRLIEGTVSQKYELPHGPHAMIETQRAFYLVPWESTHAQKWGKRIKGRVLSGGGIDWDVGRTRGIGR